MLDSDADSAPWYRHASKEILALDTSDIDDDFTHKEPSKLLSSPIISRKRGGLTRIWDLSDDEIEVQSSTITNIQYSSQSSPFEISKSKRARSVVVLSSSDKDTESFHSTPLKEVPSGGDESSSENLDGPSEKELLKFVNSMNIDEFSQLFPCLPTDMWHKLKPFTSLSKLGQLTKDLKSCSVSRIRAIIFQAYLIDNLIQECVMKGEELERLTASWCVNYIGEIRSDRVACNNDDSFSYCSQFDGALSKLTSYQIYGINWLLLLHESSLGGILADEMGLGKSVQIIGFIAHLVQNLEYFGRFLIVVPASTLDNWLDEFKRWSTNLEILSYYGSQRERFEFRCNFSETFDVMLTTYQIATGHVEDRKFLRRCKFDYVILDEGHMVKNLNSSRYNHLHSLRAPHRILITGTPLQNGTDQEGLNLFLDLHELMSLLNFINPDLFKNHCRTLQRLFKTTSQQDLLNQHRISRARAMMQPFVLRRVKSQVLKQLTPKHERLLYCSMDENQKEMYENVLSAVLQDPATRNMALRKVANHPLLMRSRFVNDNVLRDIAKCLLRNASFSETLESILDQLLGMSDYELDLICREHKILNSYKLPRQVYLEDSAKMRVLFHELQRCSERGDRCLIFSQFTSMLDIIGDVLSWHSYKFLRLDGSTVVSERLTLINRFNSDENIFVMLLSTRAGGVGINLTSANVVFLFDLDSNPHNDAQAQDRCHRVGQTKDVTINKIILRDTVDESIYSCAVAKLELEKHISKEN